jgi:hypothetical protein
MLERKLIIFEMSLRVLIYQGEVLILEECNLLKYKGLYPAGIYDFFSASWRIIEMTAES